MKIGIIGTRGIPNRYGGFEQLAELLSAGLFQNGHEVIVYNSHRHPYRQKSLKGVEIVHVHDPEYWMGTVGQFFYDLNCLRDAGKRNFDVLLFLGYTSSSVWRRWFPKKAVIISNMDGLEWRRSKYSKPVRKFLQYAEKWAVRYSDFLIADSQVIQAYLKNKYNANSQFIAYGAETEINADPKLLAAYNVEVENYFMLMARMEPENNIEMILEGFHNSGSDKLFLVVGDTGNSFGRSMLKKFMGDKRIIFAGAIYDRAVTHALRRFCSMYFHGHSAGGTNPSLLEAMGDKALIAAHDNEFNRAVINEDGYYFRSAEEVRQLTASVNPQGDRVENNLAKISTQYNWPAIIQQYDAFITHCYTQLKK